FAKNPHPLFAKKYYPHLYQGLAWETVRGDKEIIPGVKVIFTPGHTAGSQSVAVDTERGKVVIPGLCSIDENYETKEVIIPGMHFDPFKAYDSIVTIRKMADIILPTHSQSLVNIKSIP
ncbi:N-acyl homoserine lactonase family protein, partial [bacterium]|nr:N-acyl homoserine lactonase family protein [bacterium]